MSLAFTSLSPIIHLRPVSRRESIEELVDHVGDT